MKEILVLGGVLKNCGHARLRVLYLTGPWGRVDWPVGVLT